MPKISELNSTSTLGGSETVPLVQSGQTKKVLLGTVVPFVNVKWYGATGDGTTNDAPFIQAAIDALGINGGTVYFPRASVRYRISSKLLIKTHVVLEGDAGHDNPGIVAGVSYAFPDYYTGTILYVDSGVGGMLGYDCTDITIGEFLAGTNADKFKYSASRKSFMRNLLWINANQGAGADIGAHGIEVRSIWHFENVQCIGFQGDGIRIDATADAGTTNPYGNASGCTLIGCKTRKNSGNGLCINGRDANVCTIIGHDSALNGEWNYKDSSLLGNLYLGCHAASGNQKLTASADQYIGAYKVTSAVAANTYIGCYTESGLGNASEMTSVCTVIGGNLASAGGSTLGSLNFAAAETAFVSLAGVAYRAPYRHINKQGTKTVGSRMGSNDTSMVIQAFGSTDDDGGSGNYNYWKLKYNALSTDWYSWEPGNAPASTVMQFPSSTAAARAPALAFPKGIFFNAASGLGGTQILIDSGTAAPTLAASSIRGDFRFNRGTTTDGIIGWRTMVGGASGQNMTIALPGDQSGPETLTDANATVQPMANKVRQVLRAPLTAGRTITLGTTNVYTGCEFKFTRTTASTGAFNLDIGGLKNLATGQWCVVGYNGSAWELLEFGSL